MTATATPRISPVPGRVLRVVLADDTPDIRLLMRLALEQLGGFHVVGEAGDGIEAIEEVRAVRPDVIVLDLAMPRMGGLEALPQLRRLCPAATILVLSGFEDESLGPVARRAGADDYLRKGASPQQIVARIRSLRTDSAPLAAPPAGAVPPQPAATSEARPGSLALAADAVLEAPFAALVVSTDQHGDRWVSAANDEARRLCGRAVAHLPVRLAELAKSVETAAAELAGGSSVAPSGTATVRTTLAGAPVSVWLHRSGDRITLVVTPDPDPGPDLEHEEADRLRRVFAAAAHEMRNPVTVLIGATQTLGARRDDLPPEVRERLFEAVQRQARALERSTADLLAASRAEAGRLTVDVRPVPLAPLLRSCAEDWADGGQVTLDTPDDLVVSADSGRLEQMLANLLSNAAKYGTPPVSISARSAGDVARIDVHDSGPGVSEAFVPHLFEEFSRETGTQVQGTGLGLYVVQSLARAQGGAAGYEHTDGRSTFWITVPLAAERRADRRAGRPADRPADSPADRPVDSPADRPADRTGSDS